MEGVKHTGGIGTRQEGGIQENVEDHIEGTPSNGPGHGVSGGAGLGAGEVAGGGEDPPVDAPAIVQQIAYGYLQFLALSRCSEGGKIGSGTLGRGGAVVRWCV